ncbi:uncharacterized protein [Prorops nasuta]|uniref:uncharacterized protein n=1 Tax=Prorops nasuta TaxID=863751 RepID=UPI0034CE5B80
MQSTHNNFQKELTCWVVPTIADRIPDEVFPRNSIQIPVRLKLADPEFHRPQAIDILIGAGTTLSLLSLGQINLSMNNNDFYLQKTRLGWLVAGSVNMRYDAKQICNLTNLENLINRFWTIEELPEHESRTVEEIQCEEHYTKTVSREINGRYTVRLPFRNECEKIGDSKTIALKRFLLLERKLNKDEKMREEYSRMIDEYISLGHMSLAQPVSGLEYYMPHHAVVKETSATTKLRIVFDASAKTNNGKSLNDLLMTGPNIQEQLAIHLMRFRTYVYVIIADIEKMYRQVWVHPEDRRFQRILWRQNGEIKSFELNTLTFGVASSPFLAIRTLHQLANDEAHLFPRAANIVKSHMYVDDLLTGANSIKEAIEIRDEIMAILKLGRFNIRQWASNEASIIKDLALNIEKTEYLLKIEPMLKTLGITWRIADDQICYIPNSILHNERLTKRNVLSEIAKIFDPLGLLGPVIFYVKKIMQDIWRSGIHWDETITPDIYTKWLTFAQQWEMLGEVTVSRKMIISNYVEIQIHGFCDASNAGYGACIYIRSQDKKGNTNCCLMTAKSRVAPLKQLTIPRLELCGALLLSKLYQEANKIFNVDSIKKVIFWCDSTIVLNWINTPTHLLKTYVANRVSTIQDITNAKDWRHIRTDDNPADAISRGQLPSEFIKNHLWFNGPNWLSSVENKWPKLTVDHNEIPEMKRSICLTVLTFDTKFIERFSSYTKLIRVIAHCLRWKKSNLHNNKSSLNATELNQSEIRVLRLVQTVYFKDELKLLKGSSIHKGKHSNLDLFLDENELIRVGGRLSQSNLEFSRKHPILLPNKCHITDCIIREYHESHFHTGIQTTHYNIREKFWIPDGRNQIRRIVKNCIRCSRFRSDMMKYKMGNLPNFRTNPTAPFIHTGIDYCGPFFIKEKKHRNRNKVKAYVCVFICMIMKAVHFEVVSYLTSEGFIAALKRFISRRGIPEHIHSDNGTNFVGANNELKEMHALFNSDNHKNIVNKFASDRRITWHFIPPLAPHFGGLWEATVKVFKHHFKRVIGETLLTFEELNTFVIEVEGILNSRPIAAVSSDPNDLQAITPAHYLIGKTFTTLPEGDLSLIPVNKLSTWQHLSQMRQNFWSRWNLEYLNGLQIRQKWKNKEPNIKLGSLVLIKDRTLPCSQWVLGRVEELHPGLDGVIRTVTLRTKSGLLKRAVNHICELPVLS